MILCAVYECKKDLKCHHDVSYYRLLTLTRRYKLRKKRRAGYLATLQQKDVSEEGIKNFRVCSRHFITTDQQGFMM